MTDQSGAYSAYFERLNESPQQDANRVTLTQQFYKSSGSKQTQKSEADEAVLQRQQPRNASINHLLSTCSVDYINCFEDCCQWFVTTGVHGGLVCFVLQVFIVYNFISLALSKNAITIHTPDFGHAFSNRTHFRAYGRFWLSSVQRARRVADEKRKEEDRRRIAVKPKSADDYVVRPDYA